MKAPKELMYSTESIVVSPVEAPFHLNDPKYRSCFCGAHVTMLSRVFMSLVISGCILNTITVRSHGIYAHLLLIPIVCLGAYGVFKESRTVLFVYIVHSNIAVLLWIVYFIAMAVATAYKGPIAPSITSASTFNCSFLSANGSDLNINGSTFTLNTTELTFNCSTPSTTPTSAFTSGMIGANGFIISETMLSYTAIVFVGAIAGIQTIFTATFLNLASYIRDRKTANQGPSLLQVIVEKMPQTPATEDPMMLTSIQSTEDPLITTAPIASDPKPYNFSAIASAFVTTVKNVPVTPFDRNDPKYYSNCCCLDVHITTLAGIYTQLAGMACFFTFWITGSLLPLGNIPLLCFGIYAVHMESRVLLICYVTFFVISGVCWAYRVVVVFEKIHIAADHGFTRNTYLITPLFILVCFVLAMYAFCQDRECSPEPSVVFKAEKPIVDTVPSVSSIVESSSPVIAVPSIAQSRSNMSDAPFSIGWKTVDEMKEVEMGATKT
ncbi:hypothetical protein PRIPAC_83472 [Pristionchus pacificus]|uniref:Uncharacterized protein n=1 Tax=Pristionchus pacificus TaxID=54126 RepID=A0A2A6BSJ8_PRIPA|nr:hypothetical protein PRIPAC_83472 [Pristionchus pacificus]|eukprot:PDM68741.1 hypothetical protein PRIPAC_47043 [Pristionchus pacificus]